MKKILLIFLLTCMCIFTLSACTKFEISNEIKPKVRIIGNIIGLEYKLGNIFVSDELRKLSDKTVEYFNDYKDDIILRLHITYNNESSNKCFFNYYIGGIKIATNNNVVSPELLLANKDIINGFVLIQSPNKHKDTPKKEPPVKIKTLQEESNPVKPPEKSGYQQL